ncbi:YegP family protein [Sphingosinicella xenopeptidilytica]|uniref:YegP family protein n=1 Tax=Sphingosinicella xenopeptidilytica TaxID=364098 RepID=A0ABW3C3V6_SPHXN|nr:DUF1508 domain-containing protein [Sphingosinicella sp.]
MLSIVKRETYSLSSFAGGEPAPEEIGDTGYSELRLNLTPVCYFEIYCGEEKRLTSTIHCGGDWRWRFCAPNGTIMARASGYRSEVECRAAIDMLRSRAAGAKIRDALQYA